MLQKVTIIMTHGITISQKVQIQKVCCGIKLDIKYYNSQKGQIIGIKNLNQKKRIYLIEFFNYDRIWLVKHEFKIIKD